MSEYHKIQSIFKREPTGKRRLIEGDWSLPEFEYLACNVWQFTEKVDGTNVRLVFTDHSNDQVSFMGRTNNAQLPTPLFNKLNEQITAEKFRRAFTDGPVVLYGEGYGAKIQKGGGNYRSDQGFVLFDVRVGHWWLKREDVHDVARRLELDVVPVIGEGTLHDAVELAKAGIKSMWGDFQAEGIVARPKVEMLTRNGDRIIAKVKCRDFD